MPDSTASGNQSTDKPWHDKQTLSRLYYEENLSLTRLADKFDITVQTVYYWMEKHELPRNNFPQSPNWRLSNGEVLPNFNTREKGYEVWDAFDEGTYKRITVHRLAAVAWFGLDRVKNKNIHHKNDIPWDNREENLRPTTDAEHARVHDKDRERNELGQYA